MKFSYLKVILLCLGVLGFGSNPVWAEAEDDEIAEIKAEMQRLREMYEEAIEKLESRIEDLEARPVNTIPETEKTRQAEPARVTPVTAGVEGKSNSFNPLIGVVFNGRYANFKRDPEMFSIPGFPLFGEAGPGPEGFSLGETELNLSANVNDLFFASTTIAFDASDEGTEVELEEAYIQTLSLPSGLTLKAGRFFAALGYLNENHSHTDNFAIRPLPYQAFLGGANYNDDGVQVAIVFPTTTYIQLGGGVFRGADFPAGGALNDGAGAFTAFARFGGDIGFSNSWLAGVSYLHAKADGQMFGEPDDAFPDLLSFTGTTKLLIAHFKYQWSPHGNIKERYFTLVGEFLLRKRDGDFNGIPYHGTDSGFYVEGMYKFAVGWRAGYRYSQLNPEDNFSALLADTGLNSFGMTPRTHEFAIDWARNEFSIVRLQFTRDLSSLFSDNRIFLQFIMSIGAHGAHNF
ncbi:MAG: hypothetical protein V3R64_03600 [Sphingomonadales bacterium]